MIPHSRPWIAEADRRAVAAVLDSEMIGQAETTARFETAFSRWLGLERPGTATASGAAALEIALVALGARSGDEVILPTYVCPSVLDAVCAVGATPRLADVGPQWVLTPANVDPLVGAATRAIIVPHMYGIFADVAAFRAFGVPIIEDCAQAIEGPQRWQIAGDVAVFSFHPTKCLTTGEGGLAISRDALLNRRLRAVRDGGAGGRRVLAPLSSVAAALGLSQLERYDASLGRRRFIAATYRLALGDTAATLLRRTPWNRTMHFRFALSAGAPFAETAAVFAGAGICVRRGVDALLHRIAGQRDRDFPIATELFDTTVSIPLYPALSDAEVEACADALALWAPSVRYQLARM
jgi:perosamine synthetase